MKASKLTPEEIFLGRIYSFIHQRAEYLRQKQTAANIPNDQVRKATVATHSTKPNADGRSLE